jgi:hypothetical protein
MVQFHRLLRWELQAECRKRGHEDYGDSDDLQAFLESDDRGSVQLPRPARIQMNIHNAIDYNEFFTYELKDECRARDLLVLGSSKYRYISALIDDDLTRERKLRRTFTQKNDKDCFKLSQFEVAYAAFRLRQAEASHKSVMEETDIYSRIKLQRLKDDIIDECRRRQNRVHDQLAENSDEGPEEVESEETEPKTSRFLSETPSTATSNANAVADRLTSPTSSLDTDNQMNELTKPKNHREVTECEQVRLALSYPLNGTRNC